MGSRAEGPRAGFDFSPPQECGVLARSRRTGGASWILDRLSPRVRNRLANPDFLLPASYSRSRFWQLSAEAGERFSPSRFSANVLP